MRIDLRGACCCYVVGPNRETQRLELRGGPKKCLHQYFYFQDPPFGFLPARLQTWFPFTMHRCLNGREGLARHMDQAGLRYARREDCFVDWADPAAAQELCNAQLKTSWKAVFQRLLRRFHPTPPDIFCQHPIHYYWSLAESEWATDVMFRSPQALAALYPELLRHGRRDFRSANLEQLQKLAA